MIMTQKRNKISFWYLFLILILLAWIGYKWYKQPSVISGTTAPEFQSVMPNGDSLSLSDLKGYWILIDFWGSWCGPCRQENKILVKLYETYQKAVFSDAKGFTILSVGIESSRERWLSAIAQDNLHWPHHVSSLNRFNDPVAKIYGIKEIPTSILISPKGNIMGVNPDYNQIIAHLSKSLKK
jgi:thiol-disulfide isomerase/thioredoxin